MPLHTADCVLSACMAGPCWSSPSPLRPILAAIDTSSASCARPSADIWPPEIAGTNARVATGVCGQIIVDTDELKSLTKYRLAFFADVPVGDEVPRVAHVLVEERLGLLEELAETMVAAAIPLRECVVA